MNRFSNIKVDEQLITKFLAGEATPAEAIAIDKWIENLENKIHFDEIYKLWNIISKQEITKNKNVNEAWEYLQSSLLQKENKRKLKFIRPLYYAAAIVAGIICIIVYKTFYTPKKIADYIEISALKFTLRDTLPDRSVIILNRNSSIKYAPGFNKTNRTVALNGEAYFNVAPDKKHPFIIHDHELNIQVVGTQFNVNSKAANSSIEVQVQSGTVSIYTTKDKIFVRKGQTGIYNKANKKFTIRDSVDVNSISYATESFLFTNISLEEISKYLEKAFGKTIQFKESELKQCQLSARFEDESLDYILHIICITLNLTYSINNNIIILDGKACN